MLPAATATSVKKIIRIAKKVPEDFIDGSTVYSSDSLGSSNVFSRGKPPCILNEQSQSKQSQVTSFKRNSSQRGLVEERKSQSSSSGLNLDGNNVPFSKKSQESRLQSQAATIVKRIRVEYSEPNEPLKVNEVKHRQPSCSDIIILLDDDSAEVSQDKHIHEDNRSIIVRQSNNNTRENIPFAKRTIFKRAILNKQSSLSRTLDQTSFSQDPVRRDDNWVKDRAREEQIEEEPTPQDSRDFLERSGKISNKTYMKEKENNEQIDEENTKRSLLINVHHESSIPVELKLKKVQSNTISSSQSLEELFEEPPPTEQGNLIGDFTVGHEASLIKLIDYQQDQYVVEWKAITSKAMSNHSTRPLTSTKSLSDIQKYGGDAYVIFLEQQFCEYQTSLWEKKMEVFFSSERKKKGEETASFEKETSTSIVEAVKREPETKKDIIGEKKSREPSALYCSSPQITKKRFIEVFSDNSGEQSEVFAMSIAALCMREIETEEEFDKLFTCKASCGVEKNKQIQGIEIQNLGSRSADGKDCEKAGRGEEEGYIHEKLTPLVQAIGEDIIHIEQELPFISMEDGSKEKLNKNESDEEIKLHCFSSSVVVEQDLSENGQSQENRSAELVVHQEIQSCNIIQTSSEGIAEVQDEQSDQQLQANLEQCLTEISSENPLIDALTEESCGKLLIQSGNSSNEDVMSVEEGVKEYQPAAQESLSLKENEIIVSVAVDEAIDDNPNIQEESVEEKQSSQVGASDEQKEEEEEHHIKTASVQQLSEKEIPEQVGDESESDSHPIGFDYGNSPVMINLDSISRGGKEEIIQFVVQ